MVISDLHYEKRIFRGVNESKAWEWLLEIVDYHKPNLLLSCGDWGSAINFEEFYELPKKTIVLSIYGNHENMDVLTRLYNVKINTYLPVLIEDGRIYKFDELKIAGINGIIAKKRKLKKGVPRKTPEDFLESAKKLEDKNIDVLLIHETPYLPTLFPFMANDFRSQTVLKTIEIVKPRIVLNGHMHSGGYKFYAFSFRTKYIYIDSSQANRHYAILYTNNMKLEIWKDFELIDSIYLS